MTLPSLRLRLHIYLCQPYDPFVRMRSANALYGEYMLPYDGPHLIFGYPRLRPDFRRWTLGTAIPRSERFCFHGLSFRPYPPKR